MPPQPQLPWQCAVLLCSQGWATGEGSGGSQAVAPPAETQGSPFPWNWNTGITLSMEPLGAVLSCSSASNTASCKILIWKSFLPRHLGWRICLGIKQMPLKTMHFLLKSSCHNNCAALLLSNKALFCVLGSLHSRRAADLLSLRKHIIWLAKCQTLKIQTGAIKPHFRNKIAYIFSGLLTFFFFPFFLNKCED